jgi:signal transduction histidine kinase
MRILSRIRNVYLSVSVIAILIVTPLFYFVTSHLFISEVDETLLERKKFITQKLSVIHSTEDIKIWQQFDDDIELIAHHDQKLSKDTLYSSNRFNALSKEYEPFRTLRSEVTMLDKSYYLFIHISLVESEDLIEVLVLAEIVLLILLLTGMQVINSQISQKIFRPFYKTLAQLQNYRLNQKEPLILDETSIKEFTELNDALSKMTEKIHSDYLILRQFTENASHEIQTPLAIINSKLELIMQDESISASQMQSLQIIFESSRRLSRLNQGLLLLTKIENNQFTQIEEIDLKKLIKDKIALYEEFITAKNLNFNLYLKEKKISANPVLAQTLVANLLQNAIRHNMSGGNLIIELTENHLLFANTGKTPEVNPENFFERFYKSSSDSDSLGLGLAIVREICDHEHLNIAYTFVNSLHQIVISF